MKPSWALVLFFTCASSFALDACVSDAPSSDASSDGGAGGNDAGGGGDATNGGDGSITDGGAGDSGSKRYCETAAVPDGAADFFCADFDGVDVREGFGDGGESNDGSTFTASPAVAASLPYSLLAHIPGNGSSAQDETLDWHVAGAKQIRTATVTAMFNPPTRGGAIHGQGATFLLGLEEESSNEDVYFASVDNDSLSTTGADAATYQGYAVFVRYFSGVGITFFVPAPDLPTETWTEVSLTLDLTTGSVTLSYDGVTKVTTTGKAVTDTSIDAFVGGKLWDTTVDEDWRFDNYRVITTRAP